MKIGFFHRTLPAAGRKVGGVEVFVHRLACSLAAIHDVEVISFTDPPPGAPYAHRKLFPRLPFLQKPLFRLWLLPLFLNFVDFSGYDVLHFHGDDWFFLFRKIPTLRTFYGSARFEAQMATRLRRKIAQRIVYRFEHLAARLADVVLGLGTEASRIYRADGIAKIFIPAAIFAPGEKSHHPSFIFIGAWGGRKRGAFVAERFLNDVLPHFPEARLYMASDFVPVSDAIIDLANPDDATLAKMLRESWALLSASTYEGFGIPYLEAIASGTVVITTRNSGAEYVLGTEAGFIVTDQDYSETILQVIRNEKSRQAVETLGLARAAVFSEPQVIAEHLNFYRLAMQRFGKERPRL